MILLLDPARSTRLENQGITLEPGHESEHRPDDESEYQSFQRPVPEGQADPVAERPEQSGHGRHQNEGPAFVGPDQFKHEAARQ